MELEERRWRAVEQVLRRLVNRLCAAAMGIDPRLDTQLAKLAESNRRGADATELRARHDSLSDALKSLDSGVGTATISDLAATIPATRPPPALVSSSRSPPNLAVVRSAAVKAVERLTSIDPADSRIRELSGQLAAAPSEAALAEVLMRIGDLVAKLGEDAARERAAAAAILAQVTERLEEMAAYLGGLNDERRMWLDDAESLNTTVLTQITTLSSEVHDATDLPSLRALVATRLESVACQVKESDTPATAFDRADGALYGARDNGRNRGVTA